MITHGFEPRRLPRPVPLRAEAPFDLLRVAVSEPVPGVTVVAPVGEADAATQGVLRNAVLDAVRTGSVQVVVDLGGLKFCGSTGLVLLLDCRRAAEEAGVGFNLVGGPPIVRRVLDITGVGQQLGHRDSLDEVLVVLAER